MWCTADASLAAAALPSGGELSGIEPARDGLAERHGTRLAVAANVSSAMQSVENRRAESPSEMRTALRPVEAAVGKLPSGFLRAWEVNTVVLKCRRSLGGETIVPAWPIVFLHPATAEQLIEQFDASDASQMIVTGASLAQHGVTLHLTRRRQTSGRVLQICVSDISH